MIDMFSCAYHFLQIFFETAVQIFCLFLGGVGSLPFLMFSKNSLNKIDINPFSDNCNVNLFSSLWLDLFIFLMVCFNSVSSSISESLI